MSIFKCKMCGGDLEVAEGLTIAECEYCGTKQTVPKAMDENMQNIFNRANTLRIKGEFDKAEGHYEKIIQSDSTQSEAYWGLILCKYGIEYVDDPVTFKKIPTCHRASYDSIIADDDYKSAIDNADMSQRMIYEEQAKEIDRIQKEILALAQKEETYDVFICYKETDSSGARTQDSVIANDIYYQLTREGFKVFYAAITLEGKLGSAYEPIIFAALNSAKVMLAIGTKPEYFNAVWVKNEWSRYLKIIKNDRSKLLIPCYRDMDAYELPDEFAHLQSQDMSKIGFINDLVRGIQKVITKDEPKKATEEPTSSPSASANVAPLLKRVFMFLEDFDWKSADEYCEKVLDIDPECAEAYLGKLMAELQVNKQVYLKTCSKPFDENNNYKKIVRFGDDNLKNTLDGYITFIYERNEQARLKDIDNIYNRATESMKRAQTEDDFKSVAKLFASIKEYKNSAELAEKCRENAETARLDSIYIRAIELMNKAKTPKGFESVAKAFDAIKSYKDAKELSKKCIEESHFLIERFNKACEKSWIRNSQMYILAGGLHTLGLKSDGTVVAVGDNNYGQCKVSAWSDIVAISGGWFHTVGLKSDGTVVAVGDNRAGECNVSDWSDIVAISAGEHYTVGLKADGTVVAVGGNAFGQRYVAYWSDIVAISAGGSHTVGLKSDGTVIVAGNNEYGECNVSDWTDIVAISYRRRHTVGLKSDGTVVAVGENEDGKCNVSDWSDIVAISSGIEHTVGLKSDGTVVAIGGNKYGQCNVSDWSDIVVISAGGFHTVGLKSDGTVVAVGDNKYGKCNVSDWSDISVPILADTKVEYEAKRRQRLEQLQRLKEERRAEERKASYRRSGVCQHCGGQFKGLFTKKCSACGKPKDY